MVADRDQLRFFVDETSLGLGMALSIARKDTVHTGHRLIPGAPRGAKDTEWMPVVAAAGLIVIGRDKRIMSRKAELLTFKTHGLRVFRIAGKRDLSTWDALDRLVRRWADIEQIVANRGAGPWFMAVKSNRIDEVALP